MAPGAAKATAIIAKAKIGIIWLRLALPMKSNEPVITSRER